MKPTLRSAVAGVALGACLAVSSVAALASPAVAATAVTNYSGTLPDGATWIADVPAGWNGTLLLFSHGYLPSWGSLLNSAQVAPNQSTADALLAQGYALTGSSYATAGWALNTAVADQLDTLAATKAAIGRAPTRVLAYGISMGGLVTAKLAETAGGQIQGALASCGMLGGVAALNNYQLDGSLAIAKLLSSLLPVKLVRYNDIVDGLAAGTELYSAVALGQATAQGRARIALAAALFQMPSWRADQQPPTDPAGIEIGQYQWLLDTLMLTVPGRYDIETALGGNSAWTEGVDYPALLGRAADQATVRALYQTAGLDLDADLKTLTDAATTTADEVAVRNAFDTSVPHGTLQMPVLTLHTTADNLAPVQHENAYADAVARSGHSDLLRQAFVAHPGHCAFTAAEMVAGVQALDHRVSTGQWDDVASTAALQQSATALGLDGAAFVDYAPQHLLRESFGGDDTLPYPIG